MFFEYYLIRLPANMSNYMCTTFCYKECEIICIVVPFSHRDIDQISKIGTIQRHRVSYFIHVLMYMLYKSSQTLLDEVKPL